ncbi:hypothetical protein CIPAW_06G001700 [Carya illinoinensis]|uniref:Integrase catalytic domain-containing protein n=1 Tax=Carya illinoinensis TaxID=32201 RepID=A0A8T1Q4L9_CARIL|nr:hypothetical protein CIPAW_06G001700 [Carya illinoinensis]
MELFTLQGVQLSFSFAYHPQTDGQKEVVNKWVQNYLSSYMGDRPKDWSHWLALNEWCYNSNQHRSTKITPFEALYDYKPLGLSKYIMGTAKIDEVEIIIDRRNHIWHLLKRNITQAQERMAQVCKSEAKRAKIHGG